MEDVSRFVVLLLTFVLSSSAAFKTSGQTKHERCDKNTCDVLTELHDIDSTHGGIYADLKIYTKENNLESSHKALRKELEDLGINVMHVEEYMPLQTYLIRFMKLIQEETEKKLEKIDANQVEISKKIEELTITINTTLCQRSPKLKEICPDGWIKNPGTKFCFYFGKKYQKMNFKDAIHFCQKLDATLASIYTENENDFITSQINSDYYWIGLSDSKVEGIFEWTDGSTAVYTNFRSGQPNNWKNQDCVLLYQGGTWSDVPCSDLNRPICKRPTNSIPDYDVEPEYPVLRSVYTVNNYSIPDYDVEPEHPVLRSVYTVNNYSIPDYDVEPETEVNTEAYIIAETELQVNDE